MSLRSSLRTGRYCKFIFPEGIASNWVAVFTLSDQWQTACWLCHELNSLGRLAVMVISQPPGNNPSYWYVASPTLPQLLLVLPETLCSIRPNLQHQDILRNGAIKHIFYTNQIHGGIISRCSLFILSLHALALHLAVKILLQIFLYEDLKHGVPYICRLYFPPECQQDRTLLRNQYC